MKVLKSYSLEERCIYMDKTLKNEQSKKGKRENNVYAIFNETFNIFANFFTVYTRDYVLFSSIISPPLKH